MTRPARHTRAAVAATGLLALAAAALAPAGSSLVSAAPATAPPAQLRGLGAPTLSAFVATGAANRRSAPVAAMVEKLNGGEAVRGPGQEAYEARAYPSTDVASAQVTAARTAFARKGRGRKGFKQVGPDSEFVPGAVTYTGVPATVSGRVTALLPVGRCTVRACTVLVGTAGGGLWRSTAALSANPRWRPVGRGLTSNAIGSLTLSGRTVYAGTGEPNGSSDSEAGTGLFASTNAGRSFVRIPTLAGRTDFAVSRSVASVVVDRRDRRHLLVGTAVARHGSSSVNGGRFTPPGAARVGLYETRNGGRSWTLAHAENSDPVDPTSPNGSDFFRGGVTRVEQDPTSPATYYAAFSGYGLERRTGAGAWQTIYASPAGGDPASSIVARTEFDAVKKGGKTRIYVGDATVFAPTKDFGPRAGLLRTDDGLAPVPTFTLLSRNDPGDPGAYASYNYCSDQCSYDMPVASPDGRPDVVYIGGQMHYEEIFTLHQPSNGRAVQRSADAGRSFTDMTNDTVNNGLHPDQHAIAFAGGVVILGSDGGVNRLTGGFANRSSDCDSRGLTAVQLLDCRAWLARVPVRNTSVNRGLQTLQFQSVSVDRKGRELLGGTQDNGTWSFRRNGAQSFESIGGDGGQSGFDAADTTIRYHSYFAPQHDVNFRGSVTTGWNWISDRLLASGEPASFYTPFVADPKVPGTVFDGLQHVWRTQDHGGDQAYLEQHCNEYTGDFDPAFPCGDFEALGRAPLTGTQYGADKRAGDYVVAITRAPKDTGTMWVGNRRGRLFVSRNANARPASSVTFTRIDTAATPTRFVSGIAVDRADSNHAIVTYSGYDAYARVAGTATGHVFDVRVGPSGAATFTDISGDIGDMPITSVATAPSTGAVYLGTDFGVLAATRPGRAARWQPVPGLPLVAVYGLTYDPAKRKVYAATHGRGIWAAKV